MANTKTEGPIGNDSCENNENSIPFDYSKPFRRPAKLGFGKFGLNALGALVLGAIGYASPAFAATPAANPDNASTRQNTPVTIDVLANDTDADPADLLTVTSVSQPPAGQGIATIVANRVRFTPANGFTGNTGFAYEISDLTGNHAQAAVSVNVLPTNNPPVATNYTQVLDQGDLVTTHPLDHVTDADPTDNLTITGITPALHGTAAVQNGGTVIVYTPNSGYHGQDQVNASISDGTATVAQTITFQINRLNSAPLALKKNVDATEDTPVQIGLVAGDAENDALTYSVVGQPQHGALTGSGQNLVYTPAANFNGTDSFTFKANDGLLDSNVATVNLSVAAVNDAPVAGDDEHSTLEREPLSIVAPGVLANDSDVDGDPLTAVALGQPAHGHLIFNPNGSFTYVPDSNFVGDDSFSYRAYDGSLMSVPATVRIHIQARDTTNFDQTDIEQDLDDIIKPTGSRPGILLARSNDFEAYAVSDRASDKGLNKAKWNMRLRDRKAEGKKKGLAERVAMYFGENDTPFYTAASDGSVCLTPAIASNLGYKPGVVRREGVNSFAPLNKRTGLLEGDFLNEQRPGIKGVNFTEDKNGVLVGRVLFDRAIGSPLTINETIRIVKPTGSNESQVEIKRVYKVNQTVALGSNEFVLDSFDWEYTGPTRNDVTGMKINANELSIDQLASGQAYKVAGQDLSDKKHIVGIEATSTYVPGIAEFTRDELQGQAPKGGLDASVQNFAITRRGRFEKTKLPGLFTLEAESLDAKDNTYVRTTALGDNKFRTTLYLGVGDNLVTMDGQARPCLIKGTTFNITTRYKATE